jgi:hypothetical protein
MDATVHILYEVAGTAGALLSVYWLRGLHAAYAVVIIPVFFAFAGVAWWFMRFGANHAVTKKLEAARKAKKGTFLGELGRFFAAFFYSIYLGGKLVVSLRMFIWLIPAYMLPLVLHRYIESTLFAFYAKNILLDGSLQQVLLGGSNLGELCGAFFVLLFSNAVASPLPWLRLDAILLFVMWVYPYGPYPALVPVVKNGTTTFVADAVATSNWAWSLFPIMICLSFGWAAGDVSLAAWIQSRLSKLPRKVLGDKAAKYAVSPLGSVMAFLYVSYIVFYAILSNLIGFTMDYYKARAKSAGNGALPIEAFIWICGVLLSACAVVIFASTFIPRGSFAFNPKDEHDDAGVPFDADAEEGGSEGVDDDKKKDEEMLEAAFAG